jgi:pheromone shutdown protein TraB
VGVDGTTLFWTAALPRADIDRFVAFVGRREVIEERPAQPDAIAAAPVMTPLGVLPLRVRRAAGAMQIVGGGMLGLGVINLARVVGLSADLRIHLLEVLGSMILYGAAMTGLGLRLARGRPHSREAAVIGGGIATVFLFVAEVAFYTGPYDLYLFGILGALALGIYGLVFYWLRKPATA